MSVEIILVWSVLALVVLAFALDRWAPEGIALAGLLALLAIGSLSPVEALAGFSSPAVIAIASLLVLGAALEHSGVVRRIADLLHRFAGDSERRLLLAGTVTPGLMSGFINIIATVSVFIPVLLRLALKTRQSAMQLLLPMAYVAMAGANLTLIGASHNLVVNDILREKTDNGFGFLEFTPVGVLMVAVATLYALLTARWLLPTRTPSDEDRPEQQTRDLFARYAFAERVWELEVQADAAVIGQDLESLQLSREYGLSVITLIHAEDDSRPLPRPDMRLAAGDILLVGGRRERVEAVTAAQPGLQLRGAPAYRDDFSAGSAELIEVLVPPRSAVIGKTVRELGLRTEHDLTAIALWRDAGPVRTDAENTPLRAGDALLLYGHKNDTRRFRPEPEYRWLHAPREANAAPQARRLAPWTVLIFLGVILCAAMDWLPIAVAALGGAVLVAVIGALSRRQVYASIDWQTVILIAAMLPFATALQNSGASELLAQWLTSTLGQWGPLAVLAAVAVATLLFTQALHNAAAAAVMAPVALDAAAQLAVNPKTFAISVVVAASMSVLLPIGHPAPMLVRPYGDYRMVHYLRFGAGMAVLTLAVILLVVPLLWPFESD